MYCPYEDMNEVDYFEYEAEVYGCIDDDDDDWLWSDEFEEEEFF